MRHDLFASKKSVHIKMTKEQHAALRTKLFRYDLTMQDLFFYAACSVLDGTPAADKYLERISRSKLKKVVDDLHNTGRLHIGEFDSETLYNLIEEDGKHDADEDTGEE